VSAQVCTARARTASSQARSSNAQHRTDFKSKRAQECLGLCCLRCFCFRRDRVGTLCPPSRCAAAQVTPLLAPLSPPASSSSTHTHNTQVPLSSIYLTQPHERLFPTLSALSSPLALLPALLLQVRRCARSQLNTQQRAAHLPLRVLKHAQRTGASFSCVPAALREHRSASLLALFLCSPSGTSCFHPHSTAHPSLVPVRHRKINFSFLFFVFVLLDALAAHAVHLNLLHKEPASMYISRAVLHRCK
jgi:hypothetical protein